MILMPGFDGTGELFSPLIAALPPTHRPTVIRYRDETKFDDYLETASAALPDHGAILIAESFSGPIALGLMARASEIYNRIADRSGLAKMKVQEAAALLAAYQAEEALAKADEALNLLTPREGRLEMLTRSIIT